MMAAYFGDRAPELTAVGLGSTASYLTGGGLPGVAPGRPVDRRPDERGAQPVATDRTPALGERLLRALRRRPSLDVTTYGTGWYPPERDGRLGIFAWTSGPAELVVSQPRRASRGARAWTWRSPATPAADRDAWPPEGAVARRHLRPTAPAPVAIDLTCAAATPRRP